MSGPLRIEPSASGNDFLIVTPNGTPLALVYRVAGRNGGERTERRAKVVKAVLQAAYYSPAALKALEAPCPHKTKVKAGGISVCFDCGEPLNSAAKRLAEMGR